MSKNKKNTGGKTTKKEASSTPSVVDEAMVKNTYLGTTFNNKCTDDILTYKQEFREYVESAATIMAELPSTFGATLSYHTDRLDLSDMDLSERSFLNPDTIRKYQSGSMSSRPDIQTVMAMCVGLQLPLPFSLDLLHKAGYCFSGTVSDIAYQTVLSTMVSHSDDFEKVLQNITDCDEILRDLGVVSLLKRSGGA